MDVLRTVAYYGPNRWSSVPTLEIHIDRSAWKVRALHLNGDAAARLLLWEPMMTHRPHELLIEDKDTKYHDVSLRDVLAVEDSFAEVMRWTVCALGSAAGTVPHFSRVLQQQDHLHRFVLAFEFEEESLARACVDTARRCMIAAIRNDLFEPAIEVRKLVDLADEVRLGPSTRAILRSAVARGVPYQRITTGSLVQLGEGARQHRIWTAETDATSSIAEDIAQDKELTKLILKRVGVPVPDGRVAVTPEQASEVASDIGYPVVLKPRDANHGRGISFALNTAQEVREAFGLAVCENKSADAGVIVEQLAIGVAHRLLVVGDRLIAACRGEQDVVVGDGKSTIIELIQTANRDPLRGENYTDILSVIELDSVCLSLLKRRGFRPESVLSVDQRVVVKINGDLTTDETDEVHPDVARQAVLAAKAVGLNVAGLDIIAEEISQPLESQRGMVIEVNAGPGLFMHVAPLHGKPQPVGDAIVEQMFPKGDSGCIVIVGIANGSHAQKIGKQLAALLRSKGCCVGMALGDSVEVDGQAPYGQGMSDREKVSSLIAHPLVESIVFTTDPAQTAATGLACDRCDVVIFPENNDRDFGYRADSVTEGCDSNAATLGADTLSLLHAVPPGGVVIVPVATDCLEQIRTECRGEVMLYSTTASTITLTRLETRLNAHRAGGGKSVRLVDQAIVLGFGATTISVAIRPESFLEDSELVFHLLPAIAAAWSLGADIQSLRNVCDASDRSL